MNELDLKALGVTALVECSTLGVGRRPDLDLAVSRATAANLLSGLVAELTACGNAGART